MSSSANPVIVPEAHYGGATLTSGADEQSALTAQRTRIHMANPNLGVEFGYRPGYILRLHLKAHEGSAIARGKSQLIVPPRRLAETSFREVTEPCFWPVSFPIDQLRFELPEAGLARWQQDHRWAKRALLALKSGSSTMDNTLLAFGRATVMILEQPERASQFFVDHILTGLCTYLFESYCSSSKRSVIGGLAPWQERRAKDLIESRLGSDLSLEELAGECGLSVAHFARAFRQSVGESPRRWLTRRRVETAQWMLVHTDTPLVLIAVECGFADQAHFTNVFTRLVGASPGAFRREKKSMMKSGTA